MCQGNVMGYRIFQPDDRSLRLDINPNIGQWALTGFFALLALGHIVALINSFGARQIFECDRVRNLCQLRQTGQLLPANSPPKTLPLNEIVGLTETTAQGISHNRATYLTVQLRRQTGQAYTEQLPFNHNTTQIQQFLDRPQQQQLRLVNYQLWQKGMVGFLGMVLTLTTLCVGLNCGQRQEILLRRDQKTLEICHYHNWMGRLCQVVLGKLVAPVSEYPYLFAWSDIRSIRVHERDRWSKNRHERNLPRYVLRLQLSKHESAIDLLRHDSERRLIDVAGAINAFMQEVPQSSQ